MDSNRASCDTSTANTNCGTKPHADCGNCSVTAADAGESTVLSETSTSSSDVITASTTLTATDSTSNVLDDPPSPTLPVFGPKNLVTLSPRLKKALCQLPIEAPKAFVDYEDAATFLRYTDVQEFIQTLEGALFKPDFDNITQYYLKTHFKTPDEEKAATVDLRLRSILYKMMWMETLEFPDYGLLGSAPQALESSVHVATFLHRVCQKMSGPGGWFSRMDQWDPVNKYKIIWNVLRVHREQNLLDCK